MSSLNYSIVVRKFLRCLPPPEDRHNKSLYCTALAQVIGCDRSLVVKEVRKLFDEVDKDYNTTPIKFYRQDISHTTLLENAGLNIEDYNTFPIMALHIINTERYGRLVGNRIIEQMPELYPVVLDFLKLQAKHMKSTLNDVTLGYYEDLGLLEQDTQDIAEELISIDDDAGNMPYKGVFHIDASQDYLDNICKDRMYLRESVIAARKYILDHRTSFEAAGLNFVDSPGLACIPVDENDINADNANMSDEPDTDSGVE